MLTKVRVGTRGSALAIAQTRKTVETLKLPDVEIIIIRTEGDDLSLDLASPSAPGVFVNALRSALLSNEVDLIVHSLKDLPVALPENIVIAGVPVREDPRDVLVSQKNLTLEELPPGAIIGTSSPRRTATIKSKYPHLVPRTIRGNVDSRINQVLSGDYDGVILAAAGLIRLNRIGEAAQIFAPSEMVPAPGQGALAIECRQSDRELVQLIARADDPTTRISTVAERAVLKRLNAGCDLPIGAISHLDDLTLTLHAELSSPNGLENIGATLSITLDSLSDYESAADLGFRVADALRGHGE